MAECAYTIQTVAVTENQKRYRRSAQFKRGGKPLTRNVSPKNSTEASKRSQHMQKVRAFMLLGGRCYNCNDNRMEALELDHVNNNGAKERREIGGSHTMIKEVFKRPNDFQLLCGSCHNLKTSDVEQAVADFKKD